MSGEKTPDETGFVTNSRVSGGVGDGRLCVVGRGDDAAFEMKKS